MENSTPTPLHVSPQNKTFQDITPSSEGDYLTTERHLLRQPPKSAFVPRTDTERDIDDNPETSQE